MQFRSASTLAAFALTGALGACGGDGTPAAPTTPTASAEGAYSGDSSTAGAPAAFILLVQHDGTFWHLYGGKTLAMSTMTGFVQGTGSSSSPTWTASNAVDFGATSPASVPYSVAWSDAHGPIVSGNAQYAGVAAAFLGGPFDATRYQYTDAAALATVARDWQMQSIQDVATTVHIAADGSLTATDASGCSLSGKLVPSDDNKNYFTATLTLGPAPCAHAGATTTGIAVAPVTMYGVHFYIATISAARDFGVGLSF